MKKALLLLHAALLAYWIGMGYFRSNAMFFAGLGVMALSLVVRVPITNHQSANHQSTNQLTWRFGLLALLCVALALAAPARTFHFLVLAFSAFFLVENLWGKINEAPAFTALLLTAVAKTMSVVLGFPMRLQLSENAAAALRLLGGNATAEGNLIRFEGKDFLVDPACAGLQMVEVSLLFCFFLLGLFERRTGRHLHWPTLLGIVLTTGLLLLIFNQLRIIFLVVFSIPPENPMHDVVGLLGLGLYVFAPLWWGVGWAFRSLGRHPRDDKGTRMERMGRMYTDFLQRICFNLFNLLHPRPIVVLHLALAALLLYFAFGEKRGELQNDLAVQALVPVGLPTKCSRESITEGVTKYTTDSLLIYVKPVRGWYDTEHTPLICWQGSGYQFGQVQERTVGATVVYMGVLEKKGGPTYCTAWWFDNGQDRTISQGRWRWLDAGGAPGFSLVNVTAGDGVTLEIQLKKMLMP